MLHDFQNVINKTSPSIPGCHASTYGKVYDMCIDNFMPDMTADSIHVSTVRRFNMCRKNLFQKLSSAPRLRGTSLCRALCQQHNYL